MNRKSLEKAAIFGSCCAFGMVEGQRRTMKRHMVVGSIITPVKQRAGFPFQTRSSY
jgi:hypothetical protein